MQDLHITMARGWYPAVRHDDNDGTALTFVKIRPWFPSDPYVSTLDVYRPKANLPEANIRLMSVQRKSMRWGGFWIVNGPSGRSVMAYALPGGKLQVHFDRIEDLDAIRSVTAQ